MTVAISVQREPGAGGLCSQARLVVGASTAVPTRVPRAEALLCGRRPSADDIDIIDDLRSSQAHRREMVRVVARCTLTSLFIGEFE